VVSEQVEVHADEAMVETRATGVGQVIDNQTRAGTAVEWLRGDGSCSPGWCCDGREQRPITPLGSSPQRQN
jgi:hypothetical protein